MSRLILIVDDERDLVEALEFSFQQEGFQTRAAYSGLEALAGVEEEPRPDLILLDLMLPDLAGTEVCRRLKADDRYRQIPIIMLTARSDEIDRVVGFELGVEDYVVKPFSTRELILRVRAILRRASAIHPQAELQRFGPMAVDFEAGQVWVDDQPLVLTALELKLLQVLTSREGRIQSRQQLLEDVWDIQVSVVPRTVDTHIKRLRHKLGAAGDMIKTRRGLGYLFSTELQ